MSLREGQVLFRYQIRCLDEQEFPELLAGEPLENLIVASQTQMIENFSLDILDSNPIVFQSSLKKVQLRVGAGSEGHRSTLDRLMKRQVLQAMQGVVVDEHIDRTLIRKQVPAILDGRSQGGHRVVGAWPLRSSFGFIHGQ